MTRPTPQTDGATLYAEFDADGAFVAGSPGFLESARDAAIAAYLERFAEFDGESGDAARAAAIVDWRDRGAAIEARTEGDHWRLLNSHPTAAGGFCLLAVDITPAKARNALGRALLRSHPLPIWANAVDTGEVIFFNDRFRELFEIDSDDNGDGDPWRFSDFFKDVEENRRNLADLETRGRIENYVLRVNSAKGREFWVTGAATLLPYQGRMVVLSAIQDVTTLKDHEATSRRSLDLVNDALRALPIGFALYDENSRLAVYNERFRELNAGIAEFIAPGVHWETMLRELARRRLARHATDREAAWVNDMLDRSDAFEDFEIERSDGRQIAVSIRPTSLGGFIMTQEDITEKRAAARLAQASERMLSEMLQASPANLCLSRIGAGEILYQSPSCARLFGVEASAKDQFARRGERADFLAELLPSGAIDNFAATARNAEGDLFPALFSARLIEFNGEEVMVSTVVDLTEQEAARDALRDANARLRDAIESLDEGFALYDAEGRLVIWNQLYAAMNRSIAAQITQGARYRDIVDAAIETGRLAPEDAETLRSIVARGPSAAPYREEYKHIDGRGYSISRNPTSDGGFVITRLDVTERRRAERQLTEQRELLHQSEKLSALGELLAGVAHELNNPLSVVVGHAMMLQEEAASDALRRRADKIGKAAERCSRIVKTFLAMARQRPATLEPTDVNAAIETALDVAGYGLRATGARIELDLTPTPPPISADADQLVQVFANLIVNAEHALKERGAEGRLRIETGLEPSGRELRIVVVDNGPGIPEAIRARVFEPFFTTKGVGDGTGVGLAFCHRIVEAHQGRIAIGEASGGGAEFVLHFPIADPRPTPAMAADALLAGVRGRVLIVEDEADVAELMAQVLASSGFAVDTAPDVAHAIALLPGDYGVILCDLNLPGRNGRALFDEVRERWPRLASRVGFVTGDTMSRSASQFLNASGRPHLEKPATPDEVRRLVMQLMEDGMKETTP